MVRRDKKRLLVSFPEIGTKEDPVTGNANGPLGAYLVKHKLVNCQSPLFRYRAIQGEAIKRPGSMEVEVKIQEEEPVEVKIAGNAVIVYQSEITLD